MFNGDLQIVLHIPSHHEDVLSIHRAVVVQNWAVLHLRCSILPYVWFTLSRIFGPKVGSNSKSILLRPSSRLGDDDACCAPAATHPKVYAEHYAARAVACRHTH
jgi:hypothetical protein